MRIEADASRIFFLSVSMMALTSATGVSGWRSSSKMAKRCALMVTSAPTKKSAGLRYACVSSLRSFCFLRKTPPSTPLFRIDGSKTATSLSSRYTVMRKRRSELIGSDVTSLHR